VLREQEYTRQALRERGLLRRSIANMTGLSRAPVTRLLARYVATGQGRVKSGGGIVSPNAARADIELLAKLDESS
jgi:CRP-like cAMP-binding protein